jgi:hypothetical protein
VCTDLQLLDDVANDPDYATNGAIAQSQGVLGGLLSALFGADDVGRLTCLWGFTAEMVGHLWAFVLGPVGTIRTVADMFEEVAQHAALGASDPCSLPFYSDATVTFGGRLRPFEAPSSPQAHSLLARYAEVALRPTVGTEKATEFEVPATRAVDCFLALYRRLRMHAQGPALSPDAALSGLARCYGANMQLFGIAVKLWVDVEVMIGRDRT